MKWYKILDKFLVKECDLKDFVLSRAGQIFIDHATHHPESFYAKTQNLLQEETDLEQIAALCDQLLEGQVHLCVPPWEKATCSECGWPAWIIADPFNLYEKQFVGLCKERPGCRLIPDTPACPNFCYRST